MNIASEIICESTQIKVAINPQSGYTSSLQNPADVSGMNWIRKNANWGYVDGFETKDVQQNENAVIISSDNVPENLHLMIEKRVTDEKYMETYRITNTGALEFFLTRENFGIHYPYNCSFKQRPNVLSDSCITHVWCGRDASWLYSAKPDGSRPYLVCMISQGDFADYSIDYDASVSEGNASHYRGALVLHPSDCTIFPGETLTLCFVYSFDENKPDEQLIDWNPNGMFAKANQYTFQVGETLRASLETAFDWDVSCVEFDRHSVPFRRNGNSINWEWTFDTLGEQEFIITAGTQKTRLRINVIDSTEDILRSRVRFITEKQQYHRPGSQLDGAYLIYDRATRKQYFSSSFRDSNSARERLAMGTIVALALQKYPDEKLLESLQKHRCYVERELFDTESMTVFDEANRNNRWKRAYNYPWMADFYLECYLALNDTKCLEYAAGIMIAYYRMIETCAQESPCIESIRIIEALEQTGMKGLSHLLSDAVIHHADQVLEHGNAMFSEEVSYTQGQFFIKIISLCHAHRLTKNPQYLNYALNLLPRSEAFRAQQPDYHTNHLGVRYWDLYWFGKMKSYGDTMPQWLCALCGEMYFQLAEETENSEYARIGKGILKNCLCVYDRSGFGSAGYLMPYRVNVHYSDPSVEYRNIRPGIVYGARYDDWANDQDWSLYYAVLRNI